MISLFINYYQTNLVHLYPANPPSDDTVIVNKALLARIEFLESELADCRSKLDKQEP